MYKITKREDFSHLSINEIKLIVIIILGDSIMMKTRNVEKKIICICKIVWFFTLSK